MSATVTDINTRLIGTAGANGSGGEVGEPGNPGLPGESVTESASPFSDENFTSLEAAIAAAGGELYPSVTGGAGGGGEDGAMGPSGGSPGSSGGNGGDGTAGGAGGAGGNATLSMTDDTLATAASPYAGGFTLDASATGGQGGTAGSGGAGGQVGDGGITGGAGGDGGNGGDAGAATTDVSALDVYTQDGLTVDVTAIGGVGGVELVDSGGSGSPFGGGEGGTGGNGGAASATLAGSTLVDANDVDVAVYAKAGDGGQGGSGGNGGPSSYSNADGGDGGNGGTATATLTGNVLTAPVVGVTLTMNEAAGGLAGAAGDDSFAGAAGSNGTGVLTFTNNIVTVGATGFGGELQLYLAVNSQAMASGYVPLNGGAGGNLVFSGNSFVGNGTSASPAILQLQLQGTGTATVNTAADTLSLDGSPATNRITGFNEFDLDNNDTFVTGTGSYTVSYSSDADTLVYLPTSGNVTLENVTSTNLILDFSGFGTALTLADVQADSTMSGGSTYIDIPGAGSIELLGFTGGIPDNDISLATACYLSGTRILTERGEVAVQDLAVGDVVPAHFAGAVPIIWIGHRRIDCRIHPRPASVWPVRVAAGAFGAKLPHRDLLLSPDHAVFVDGVLIPIRRLINDTTIVQEPRDIVTYWHVELQRHDVLSAEGLPCESYLDTGNRAAFSGEAVVVLAPSFADHAWSERACAPLVETGPRLAAVRAGLSGGADPAVLDLVLDKPGRVGVVAGPRIASVRLLSGACRQGDDRRLLGALITGLRIDGAAVELDDGRLMRGWHDIETHDGRAVLWTDGAARIAIGRGVAERRIDIEVAAVSAEAHAA